MLFSSILDIKLEKFKETEIKLQEPSIQFEKLKLKYSILVRFEII